MSTCPSEATLQLIGTDAIDLRTFAALEAHIEQCTDCQTALERLASAIPGEKEYGADPADPGSPWPTIPGFEIERELGRGSSGVVYLASEPHLERHVALKVVPGGPVAGSRGRARWLTEARAVARLKHTNIIRLHRVEQTPDWLVLVLEHVPGGTLKDWLNGPVPAAPAAAFLESVALAVDHIHQHGLVHLDLKPSNILLEGDSGGPLENLIPKLSDFGIARPAADAAGTDGSLAGPRGTPAYMAPEQAAPGGRRIGPAADIYALGAILYHLLTGRPPFQAGSVLEMFDLIRRQEPAPPRQLDPRIPRDLETICLTCLNKEPGRRYPTARAVADDLRRFLDGRPITARPASLLEHASRWCRRRPLTAGLLATLAVTLTGSAVALAVLLRHSRTERKLAEAASTTAQANYQVASETLDELLQLTTALTDEADIRKPPTPASQKAVEAARSHALELFRKSPGRASEQQRLATVDALLASMYIDLGRHADARAIIQESNGLWDTLGEAAPGDADVAWNQLCAAFVEVTLMSPDEIERQVDELNAKFSSIVDRLQSDPRHPIAVLRLTKTQRLAASALAQSGEPEHARRVLEHDLALLDSLPSDEAQLPELALSRRVSLVALGRHADLTEPLPAGRWHGLDRKSLTDAMVGCLAESISWQVGWLRLDAEAPEAACDRTTPSEWADDVLATLEAQRRAMGLEPEVVPLVAWKMHHAGSGFAARLRRAGRLQEARRVIAREFALAERLTTRYSRRPESFMLVSESYVQTAKNASRENDDATAERSLRRALEVARQALALEPEHEEVRRLVDDRRRRLDRLAAERRSNPHLSQ